jgi:hypothetical protein
MGHLTKVFKNALITKDQIFVLTAKYVCHTGWKILEIFGKKTGFCESGD